MRPHDFREWTVEILLQGDFESCFKDGDNSKILATDTMKNTVYSLARESSASCMEEFAKELVDFSAAAQSASVACGGNHRGEAVGACGDGREAASDDVRAVERRAGRRRKLSGRRGGKFSIASGIENLVIMKTAGSGFEGYIQDSLTTLPPTADRLVRHGAARELEIRLRRGCVRCCAGENTRNSAGGVRRTRQQVGAAHPLCDGRAGAEEIAEVGEIELTMPNMHCLLVDLSRFGQDNPNEIFVPTDEPHGTIEATLRRKA